MPQTDRLYSVPGIGALALSLGLVALLLASAVQITYSAAQASDLTATATPVGAAPEYVSTWIQYASPRGVR